MRTKVIVPKLTYTKINYPSYILCTWDKLYGEGYELYEHGYRCLISKDLGQVFRVHAILIRKGSVSPYTNITLFYS